MSRRTRIKMGGRSKERFTLAHHSDYASTTTYFPRAYSFFGNDITFPISVLPLHSKNKITYAGSSSEFFEKLNDINFNDEDIQLVSISVQGQQYQRSVSSTNLIVLVISMLCFCFHWMLRTSAYRSRFYPKYRFDDFETLINIVKRFKNVDTLIINFQDNDFDEFKMAKMDEAFAQSQIKTIVFRNLTYFIEIPNLARYFPKIRSKPRIQFKFIWQKYLLLSNNAKEREEEETNPLQLSDRI